MSDFVFFTGPFYNMTPEERIDADHRSVYVGNVSLVCIHLPIDVSFLCFVDLRTNDLPVKIPGRLRCYCRRTGDPFQWLRSCQQSHHPVRQVLRASQGVGWTTYQLILECNCIHCRLIVVLVSPACLFLLPLALLTSNFPIETLWRVLLDYMRLCSEEESLRWAWHLLHFHYGFLLYKSDIPKISKLQLRYAGVSI